MCANDQQDGCLTSDISAKIHSCEKGNYCETVKNSSVVWIQPIIAHLPDGVDMIEAGAGGGTDDVGLELGSLEEEDIMVLCQMCVQKVVSFCSALLTPRQHYGASSSLA